MLCLVCGESAVYELNCEDSEERTEYCARDNVAGIVDVQIQARECDECAEHECGDTYVLLLSHKEHHAALEHTEGMTRREGFVRESIDKESRLVEELVEIIGADTCKQGLEGKISYDKAHKKRRADHESRFSRLLEEKHYDRHGDEEYSVLAKHGDVLHKDVEEAALEGILYSVEYAYLKGIQSVPHIIDLVSKHLSSVNTESGNSLGLRHIVDKIFPVDLFEENYLVVWILI